MNAITGATRDSHKHQKHEHWAHQRQAERAQHILTMTQEDEILAKASDQVEIPNGGNQRTD